MVHHTLDFQGSAVRLAAWLLVPKAADFPQPPPDTVPLPPSPHPAVPPPPGVPGSPPEVIEPPGPSPQPVTPPPAPAPGVQPPISDPPGPGSGGPPVEEPTPDWPRRATWLPSGWLHTA